MSPQPYLEPAPKPNPDNRTSAFLGYLQERTVKWDPKTVQYASKTLRGAKWLIDEHFDVNTGFTGGYTILCLAVSYNKEDVIRFLL
ncbi:hypothetical protein HBH70_023700 [Parastagonospora nodorum]|nr:hypothetical protein HBH47_234420 [Parastagonospora nodorum]KAH4250333.1 hypothetical protein HBI03_242460 [Parastagonospora nodorum]KAH4282700.1 hypothetical protein HBI04_034930 [Parastagonospora nodorum]KAH5150208.1 hypothetical protein HBH70_023700 [Parastagonospora nodorum]KAH5449885.1 hypothetical protein HBI31_244610 [Parastagonospora nodorum]